MSRIMAGKPQSRSAFIEALPKSARSVVLNWAKREACKTDSPSGVLFLLRGQARRVLNSPDTLFSETSKTAARALLAALEQQRGSGAAVAFAGDVLETIKTEVA